MTRWIRFTKKGHSFSTTCFQLRTWSRSKILGLLSTKAWKGMKVRTVKKTLLWMMKMLNYIPWVDKIKWRQLKWFRCHIKIKLLKQSLSSEKSWEWNAYLLWQYLYFSLINYFSKTSVIRKKKLKIYYLFFTHETISQSLSLSENCLNIHFISYLCIQLGLKQVINYVFILQLQLFLEVFS